MNDAAALPLSALRAFEAVARRASFKAAAAELNVTATAVSHQVRALEEQLGVRVLERTPRYVRLTAEGRILFDAAVQGFAELRAGVAAVRRRSQRATLTLSATAAFLSAWLVPRLAGLHAALPDLDLRLHASDEPVDLHAGEIDIAIRYGMGPYPGVQHVRLREDRFVPVCHPRLAVRRPEDLLAVPLLHIEGRRVPDQPVDWERWRRRYGPAALVTTAGPRFNDVALVMQAAIAGHGVAILSLVLVQDALASGLLVRPFDGVLEGAAYHWLAAPAVARRAEVARLQTWFSEALADHAPSSP